MKINIPDKKDFINNFVAPISTLNSVCCLSLKKTSIRTICSDVSNTLLLVADTPASCEEEKTINLPDIKRLSGILAILKKKDIVLDVSENNVKYNDGEFKFSYHLLEDSIVKKPTINYDKIKKLSWDTTFTTTTEQLDTLFKGSSFASNTNKVYFVCENGSVISELGDKTKHNVDNFITTVSPSFEGKEITKPIPVSLDTFRLLTYSGAQKINFGINTQYGVIKIEFTKGNTDLTYVISALIN